VTVEKYVRGGLVVLVSRVVAMLATLAGTSACGKRCDNSLSALNVTRVALAADQPSVPHACPREELPLVGALVQADTPYCSATAIGPHTILTAAHCLDGLELEQASVYFETTDSVLVDRRVVGHVAHPGYDRECVGAHDLAVAKVDGPELAVPPIVFGPRPRRLSGFFAVSGEDVGARRCRAVTRGAMLQAVFDVKAIGGRGGFCQGDSGSLVFDVANWDDVVAGRAPPVAGDAVGVMTNGTAGCDGFAVTQRLDVHRGWIEEMRTEMEGG
jgi:hypothetical protein